jgi:lipoate-protein ligase A
LKPDKKNKIRVLDTKALNAAENMALDEAILEAREDNLISDTIRFLSFEPHCALVGYFQNVENEIRESFCTQEGIEINRRITGGGALYWGVKDIGWEIFASADRFAARISKFEDYYSLFCGAASRGINMFGLKSSFRPRNDIEIDGKKISGSGGTSIRECFLFQGTLLVDINLEIMLRALKIPVEKLKYNEINSLKDRVTWLARELGYCPDREEIIKNLLEGFSQALEVEYYFDELSEIEKKIFRSKIGHFKSKNHICRVKGKKSVSIIRSVNKTESGVIRCNAAIDTGRKILKSVNFTGDFFIYPGRAVFDVESVLKNISIGRVNIEESAKQKQMSEKPVFENTAGNKSVVEKSNTKNSAAGKCLPEEPAGEKTADEKLAKIISNFYKNYPQPIRGITAQDLSSSVLRCIEKLDYKKHAIPKKYYNDIYIVETANSGSAKINTDEKIGIFLLPYCAKLPKCEYRLCEGCNFCGKCSTGELVKLLDDFGIKSTTITSYEHLEETLKSLKAGGTKFFGGCCCEAFYVKHKQDFEDIGLPGILINIGNNTCYDLGKESDAHHGKFEGFTEIKLPLVKKILKIYNPRELQKNA